MEAISTGKQDTAYSRLRSVVSQNFDATVNYGGVSRTAKVRFASPAKSLE